MCRTNVHHIIVVYCVDFLRRIKVLLLLYYSIKVLMTGLWLDNDGCGYSDNVTQNVLTVQALESIYVETACLTIFVIVVLFVLNYSNSWYTL